jgi:multidrug efflux pump subunit AcrA (membrane-fusion protein)
MTKQDTQTLLRRLLTGLVLFLVAAGVVLFLLSPARDRLFAFFKKGEDGDNAKAGAQKKPPVELIRDGEGHQGLRISDEAMAGLEVNPVKAEPALQARPLPPQIGSVNYDNDRLFAMRPRFPGEIIEIKQVEDTSYPYGPKRFRPLRFGDKIQQGELLGVLWSKDLGIAKAALVDAIVNKRLSEDVVARQEKLFYEGGLALATFEQSKAKLASDSNAYATALRTLNILKVEREEIEAIEKEAREISDKKKKRDPELEKNWARVEIRAPIYAKDAQGRPDPKHELTVVEKNTNLWDMVDPGRDLPLFRLADLSRLQIWVHPPEEYLPLLREQLRYGPGALKWKVRFQAEPAGSLPLELPVSQLSPSLEPNQKTPMLIGYLDNPEGKYLIGQFVTATIYTPAPENTVEVPTDAVNLVDGQYLVFARSPEGKKNEFYLRRVAVAQSHSKATLIRSKLTEDDEKLSQAEQARNRRKIEPLHPGELVLTRGVVELTAALEDLLK